MGVPYNIHVITRNKELFWIVLLQGYVHGISFNRFVDEINVSVMGQGYLYIFKVEHSEYFRKYKILLHLEEGGYLNPLKLF